MTAALLAWAALLVFFAQLHPFDCSEIGATCYKARFWGLAPKVAFALSIWGLTGWLTLRDWSKN